jgi:uncharacterized protein YkwD
MPVRVLVRPLAWVVFLCPAVAYGQSVEEEHGEVIQITGEKPVGGKVPDLPEAVKRIVARTNEFRKAEGRQPVEVNPKLVETARYFADFMARTDKYGHTADDSRPADRAKKHGYDYCLVSENIAYQFNTAGFATKDLAEGFFTGWKESPGHRKNMLDPDVTQTGVAVAQSETTGYFYAVQMFGRPKSQAIEFRIANQSDVEVVYTIGDETFPLLPRYTRTHTRCRPSDVTMKWPDEAAGPTVRPERGDRYAIVRDDAGKLALKKERGGEGREIGDDP